MVRERIPVHWSTLWTVPASRVTFRLREKDCFDQQVRRTLGSDIKTEEEGEEAGIRAKMMAS